MAPKDEKPSGSKSEPITPVEIPLQTPVMRWPKVADLLPKAPEDSSAKPPGK